MAQENNAVEDVERVELPGSSGGENAEDPEGEDAEGAEGEEGAQGADPQQPNDTTIVPKKPEDSEGKKPDNDGGEGKGDGKGSAGDKGQKPPKPVEGETPRERALRQKLDIANAENRRLMGQGLNIGGKPPEATPPKKELPPEKAEVLKKYKPEEIEALKEVLPVLAEDMGFVKATDLQSQTYEEKSQEVLDEFLNQHPEYMPENDKDGVLWERFGKEFRGEGVMPKFAKPQNPKDYRKILNRIHNEIFGIKSAGDKGAVAAAQRKITVASHAGASGPTRPVISSRPKAGAQGLRMDMLKGFSEEEMEEMSGGEA